MKSSIYSIQEIEIQVFITYFVFLCEDWRGICSLSDKILLMQLGTKTAFGANAMQKYGTLNTPRYISTSMLMQVGKSYPWHCMPLHSKLNQKCIVKPRTQTTDSLGSTWYWVMNSQMFSIGWNLLGSIKAVCVHYSDLGPLFPLFLFRCWP